MKSSCADRCSTKFGGLSYKWRLYRSVTGHAQMLEYENLAAMSDTGKHSEEFGIRWLDLT